MYLQISVFGGGTNRFLVLFVCRIGDKHYSRQQGTNEEQGDDQLTPEQFSLVAVVGITQFHNIPENLVTAIAFNRRVWWRVLWVIILQTLSYRWFFEYKQSRNVLRPSVLTWIRDYQQKGGIVIIINSHS